MKCQISSTPEQVGFIYMLLKDSAESKARFSYSSLHTQALDNDINTREVHLNSLWSDSSIGNNREYEQAPFCDSTLFGKEDYHSYSHALSFPW